jgi:hypothetical protein
VPKNRRPFVPVRIAGVRLRVVVLIVLTQAVLIA